MRRFSVVTLTALSIIAMLIGACRHKTPPPVAEPDYGKFPDAIGKIMVNKCATSGCHNATSYKNSASLLLDTWEHLFLGGSNGAEVVPYCPDYSPLLYFVNTDPARGTVALPTMPYDATGTNPSHLSTDEYNTLKAWITDGAPDKDGNIAFASDPDTRQKFYLSQQGCDLVAVIDAQSGLVMRYFSVGTSPTNIESPHCLKISSDGLFGYVSFLNGNAIQKFDTRTDQLLNSVTLGAGSWNILYLAPGDTALATSDWTANGRVIYANTKTMTSQPWLTGGGSGLFIYPHGIASDATFDTCFITAQYGNLVYRYAPKIPDYRKVSIDGNPPAATNNGDNLSPNPHEILMAPDYSKYFLTCQGTNEIRVMDAHTDQILKAIPVGTFPQEMALSHSKPYLFVTCMEDEAGALPGRKGSVYVINYNTYEVVSVIHGDFYQPHGITVDDRSGKVLVASTNANPSGPAPHHATACGGRAGWYSIISLSTLLPVSDKRYQVAVMPYSADIRFRTP
jgi:DNA-binding beta-propeller fold protein YncE